MESMLLQWAAAEIHYVRTCTSHPSFPGLRWGMSTAVRKFATNLRLPGSWWIFHLDLRRKSRKSCGDKIRCRLSLYTTCLDSTNSTALWRNRTRDLLVCNTVSQPNEPPRRLTPMLISVKCFLLPVPRLSYAANRYLPGYDLHLIGLKKCRGKWEGLHNVLFTASAKIGSYSWVQKLSKFD